MSKKLRIIAGILAALSILQTAAMGASVKIGSSQLDFPTATIPVMRPVLGNDYIVELPNGTFTEDFLAKIGCYGPFRTIDEAALDWAKRYNGKSISSGKEYSSYIYYCPRYWPIPKWEEMYFYKPNPAIGSMDRVTLVDDIGYSAGGYNYDKDCPTGTVVAKAVATIHSHGKYNPLYNVHDFSQADFRSWYNFNLADENLDKNITLKHIYLADPTGRVQKATNVEWKREYIYEWRWEIVPIKVLFFYIRVLVYHKVPVGFSSKYTADITYIQSVIAHKDFPYDKNDPLVRKEL